MNIHRLSLFIGLAFFCVSAMGVYAQSAVTILDKASSVYERSNGIDVSFKMITRAPNRGVDETEGVIQMKGDKFVLETPDSRTWFNGTTQWTYVDRNEEVNITNPTGEELRQTNPALLLNSYKKDFTATNKGESTAFNGKVVYDILLIPKKKGDIVLVELQIEKYSSLPVSVTVETKNGVRSTIQISKIKTGINQSDRTFSFNDSEYPDAEIIDLR